MLQDKSNLKSYHKLCHELKAVSRNVSQGEKYTGAPGDIAPEMKKEPSKIKKEPLKIAIECSLFNVAELVNGMWKV